MTERLEFDFVRDSINDPHEGIPGIDLPPVPLLGVGGQAWVFAARENSLPRALKVHRPPEGVSVEEAQRAAEIFENEGNYLRQFDHPNIIKVFRTGVHRRQISTSSGLHFNRDYPYMLMEFAELGSVADRIKHLKDQTGAGILPAEEAILCILHATEGMRYAHGEFGLPEGVDKVTHGDLKPGNLVIAAAGGRRRVVKVADFGIARKGHSSETSMSVEQYHAFSRAYASPNQIAAGNVFFRDDVFSLGGVTAYELLAGERPLYPYIAEITPIERTRDGKVDHVIEALNVPIMGALRQEYKTMGEYQAVFKEALELGSTEAAKRRTVIIMPGEKTTVPLGDKLLEAELPPEAITERIIVPGAVPETEATPGTSRRKFLAGVLGMAVVGTAGAGVLIYANRESPAERAEREKREKEQAAVAGIGFKIADLLAQQVNVDTSEAIPAVLEQIIPCDPKGVVPRIEKMLETADMTAAAAMLGARLAYYDQESAHNIMQQFLDRQRYAEAAIIATQLASVAQGPDGHDYQLISEVNRVKNIVNQSNDPGKIYYDQMLSAALDPTSEAALKTLNSFGGMIMPATLRALCLAMARFSPEAVNNELLRLIRTGNSMIEATDIEKSNFWKTVEQVGTALAPFDTDRLKASLKEINIAFGSATAYGEEALARIASYMVTYDAQPAIDYIKNGGGENPANWQSVQTGMEMGAALGRVNPSLVSSYRTKVFSPYTEWLDLSLNPLDPDLSDKAFAVIRDGKSAFGNFVINYGVGLAINLAESRQPKRT